MFKFFYFQVIAVAMILSCIFKKFKDEEEEDDVALAKLQDDEEPIDVTAPDLSKLKSLISQCATN